MEEINELPEEMRSMLPPENASDHEYFEAYGKIIQNLLSDGKKLTLVDEAPESFTNVAVPDYDPAPCLRSDSADDFFTNYNKSITFKISIAGVVTETIVDTTPHDVADFGAVLGETAVDLAKATDTLVNNVVDTGLDVIDHTSKAMMGPILIIGGVAVIGVLAYLMMRKK